MQTFDNLLFAFRYKSIALASRLQSCSCFVAATFAAMGFTHLPEHLGKIQAMSRRLAT